MLHFFNINSKREVEWVEDDDPSSFIVPVAVVNTEFGCSNFICTNGTKRRPTLRRLNVVGHHTLNTVSQFDMKTEASVTCSKE